MFSTLLVNFLPFSSNLKLLSANSFGLEESKICRLGKQSPKNQLVRSSLLGKTCQGKWIIFLCLTVGRVQNGRCTRKNFEILWTLERVNLDKYKISLLHGGESHDTTTTTMTDIWKKSLTSGKKIFNNSVNTWPIGIWFEAEKVEGLQGFAWCVRFFKQHLIKKLLTSKQIFYPG